MRKALFPLTLVALTVAVPARAADDKKACLESYEKAQRLRADVKLRASIKELATCSRDVCPALIKKECGKWLEEVDQSMPSVVFEVTGPDGREVADVKVTMDDEVLVTEITGTAVVVDPGNHAFKFERAGQVLEERFVIREGEKRRKLEVSFVPKLAPAPAPAPPPAPTPPPQPNPIADPTAGESRPVPAIVWVLGGIGVVSLGAFAGFAFKGIGEKSDLDACKPRCTDAQIDDNKRTFVVADVFLGVGVVALGTAAVLFFTRPAEPARARIDVRAVAGGAALTWGGGF